MLTCEICAEEFLLEEDIKTHLLLSHAENEMACPLCCLSGVSYDELSFHISTAHPEGHERATTDSSGRGLGFSTKVNSQTNSRRSESCNEPAASRSRCDAAMVASVGASIHPAIRVPLGGTPANRQPLAGGAVMTKTVSEVVTPPGPDLLAKTPGNLTRTPRTSTPSDQQSDQHLDEDTVGVNAEHSKAKQKRISSPRKDVEQFPCPMCALVCSDCFILQEHVELHLQEENVSEGASSLPVEESPSSSSTGGGRYECPLCSLVCEDSASLQEHVELHLDSSTDTTPATDTTTDLRMARRLQEEDRLQQARQEAEDFKKLQQEDRLQEAKQEAEDFKKLQKQFGLDGSGGYRRQMERTMERAVSRGQMVPADFHAKRAAMMESLASGLDDGRTRTQGLLGVLCEWYQREARDCVQVWLCAETDHYCSSDGDKGWGCGYRNFQMLLSSLSRTEPYTAHLAGSGLCSVPSIPRVQGMIEGAWREGLDPQGASHFNQRLQGTRAWIGATEIYSLLTSLGVSARIVDFHQPSGPGNTHPRLFEWVKQYFSLPTTRGARLAPRVAVTSQPPLYLQHQGHSRSIVGVEQRRNGSLCLLLLDPGCTAADMRKILCRDGGTVLTAVRRLRKFPSNLKHQQYQVVAVEGVLSPEDKQSRIQNSRTLRAERIP